MFNKSAEEKLWPDKSNGRPDQSILLAVVTDILKQY